MPLLGAVALGVLRVLASIVPPIARMALCPGLLYPLLVLAIVRIVLAPACLPTPSPFALAGGSGTKALLCNLRAWPKGGLARLALPEFQSSFSPHEVVMSCGKIRRPA